MVAPPRNKLTYTLLVNDKTLKWSLQPRGHTVVNILIFVLLLVIPPATALLTVSLFKARFYAIKVRRRPSSFLILLFSSPLVSFRFMTAMCFPDSL